MDEYDWRRHGSPYWMSKRFLHTAFLAFFVLFFVVGIALSVLGFLDYGGNNGTVTRAFRILGVVALLLCIGFLIAACVVVSECITASIKRASTPSDDEPDGTYAYRALYPSSTETLVSDRHTMITQSESDHSTIISNAMQTRDQQISGPSLGVCPSCSCQLIARPVPIRATDSRVSQSMSYPNGIVQFQKKRDTAIIQLRDNESFNNHNLPDHLAPIGANFSDSGSVNSEDEERTTSPPREWV